MLGPINVLPQVGTLKWIGLSPGRKATIVEVDSVKVEVGTGLEGDRHSKGRPGGKRQVTLIQAEHLPIIQALSDSRVEVTPALLRRNLMVSGINLLALRNRQFWVGDVLLEGTGQCHPCSRMETYLGPGGFNAMRGHGGLTARVIEGGIVSVGDDVKMKV